MRTSDFYFDLPKERIALYPAPRGESRLLVVERAAARRFHHAVSDLPRLLESGSLLVFNDSRVRKARVFASGADGKPVEFLLLNPVVEDGAAVAGSRVWETMVKKPGKKIGKSFYFEDGMEAGLRPRGSGCALYFKRSVDDAWLDRYGHIPLPPYIKRPEEARDSESYQTIYARNYGSSAAPTAGLHFTEAVFSALKERGIETVFITLHVGLGTFLPVRSERVEDHRMHKEFFCVEDGAAAKIEAAKRDGRKVVAVGTTTLRALEAAASGGGGKLLRGEHSTDIFIYGDYKFKTADALFTNFHTPESTLLMLVSSFAGAACGGERAGRELIMETYREAIQRGYNFFSYGDAMLIL
jgi:S-adenosylmethionine:tRNA ribosyltransferase-isomerase